MRGRGRYFAVPADRNTRARCAERLAEIDRLWPDGYGDEARAGAASDVLERPNTLSWVLEGIDRPDGVGCVWATNVQPGHTCDLHMACWDGQLLDKAGAVDDCIRLLFRLDEWKDVEPLRHVGCQIPSHSFGTAWWAVRDLGFGGAYTYRRNGKAIPVEGVRTACMPWGDELHDLILLGRHATVETSEAKP